MILCGSLIVCAGGFAYHRHTVRQQQALQRMEKEAATKRLNKQSNRLKRQISQTQLAKNDSNQAKITKILQMSHFVGTALVVKNDRVIYQKGFGYANKEVGVLNGPNSKYQILSIQKSLTAVGIMHLVEQGKIKLSDPISKYYPELNFGGQTTIRQMLDMSSGFKLKSGSKTPVSEAEVLKYATTHLEYYPDKDGVYNYSSINFLLLAGVIRKLTGKSYQQFFEQYFIKKLKLPATGFMYNGMGKNGTVAYQQSLNQVVPNYATIMPETEAQMHNELGTGQVYMSASDLFKVESAILKGRLISRANVKVLHAQPQSGTYAGGLYLLNNGYRSRGLGYGDEADVHLSKDGKTGLVLMSNYFRAPASIEPAAGKIFDELMKGDL